MSQIEDIIAKAVSGAPFFPGPRSTAKANAILVALDAAGFVVVPKEPTPEMISTAAPLAARAPGERDFVIALTAVNLLPPNEHPDIADVLAQMAVDYRAMIEARPK